MGSDAFGTYHPIVNFIYFLSVIVFGMIFVHPLLLAASAAGAVSYACYLNGSKGIKLALALIPMMIVVVLINAAFNHRGMTLLFYIHDNPVTLESVLYGCVTALMIFTVIMWFSSYNKVMTSDKFIYLFGRVIPVLSLIFSMVLRFVPHFTRQFKIASEGQKSLDEGTGEKGILKKANRGLKVTSIVTTWALENAIDTADSMRSRGYGLPGRTAFSLYRFDRRDACMSVVLTSFIVIVLTGAFLGRMRMQFYPVIKPVEMNGFTIFAYIVYLLLCFLPLAVDILEDVKWQRLQSKI